MVEKRVTVNALTKDQAWEKNNVDKSNLRRSIRFELLILGGSLDLLGTHTIHGTGIFTYICFF